MNHPIERGHGIVSRERRPARERPVGDGAEREHVGAVVDFATLGLLRRHVARRTDRLALRERAQVFFTNASTAGNLIRIEKNGTALTEVAGGLGTVYQVIPSADGYVYLSGSSVWRVPAAGGSKSNVAPKGSSASVDATHVFVIDAGTIYRYPKQGGPPTTVYTGAPKELSVDATHVYWVESVGSESRVLKLPKPK